VRRPAVLIEGDRTFGADPIPAEAGIAQPARFHSLPGMPAPLHCDGSTAVMAKADLFWTDLQLPAESIGINRHLALLPWTIGQAAVQLGRHGLLWPTTVLRRKRC